MITDSISPVPMISSAALQNSINIILSSIRDDEKLVKVLMNFKASYFPDAY